MGVSLPDVRCRGRAIPTPEDKPLIPTSVYAISKRDHEELCLVVGAAYGVPTVALRFFNVYGPGQSLSNLYTGVAAIFASRLLNQNAPVIFEDGQQSRDFIHVSDIVAGIVSALDVERAPGERINLGTGRAATVDDVARALARGLGVEIAPDPPGSTGPVTSGTAMPIRLSLATGSDSALRSRSRKAWRASWIGSAHRRRKISSTRRRASSRREVLPGSER